MVCIKLLLEKGANMEVTTEGMTSLMFATEEYHEACVRLLESWKGL